MLTGRHSSRGFIGFIVILIALVIVAGLVVLNWDKINDKIDTKQSEADEKIEDFKEQIQDVEEQMKERLEEKAP